MIYGAEWESHPFDELLVAEFHRAICGDLVPDWAGKWRSIEVRVGNLQPPLPHNIPVLMRNYGAYLAARGAQIREQASEYIAILGANGSQDGEVLAATD